MGVPRTYSSVSGYVMPENEDADDRWRDVFFALLKRANIDEEFRARVEATGAVIKDFEAVLSSARVAQTGASGSTISCHEYWWGFQLEIPHAVLAAWDPAATDFEHIVAAIGPGIGPSGPFRRRVAIWIAGRLVELQHLDRGAGVYASMTWMAPNIFIPTAIPVPDR